MSHDTTGSHTVLPFLYLRQCAGFHLQESERTEQNPFHSAMSCIIFSAFTMEAFLNYVGSCVFDFWDELERHLTSVNKINVICSQLKIRPDFSDRPFQSLEQAFNLKYYLNQGRIDSYSRTISLSSAASACGQDEWEKQCNPADARKIYDDMLQVMDILGREIEGENYPLSIHEVDEPDLLPKS